MFHDSKQEGKKYILRVKGEDDGGEREVKGGNPL